jgi:hypothetical protein
LLRRAQLRQPLALSGRQPIQHAAL